MFYLDLFRALDKHRVEYLLVGGLAMNLHGVPRMTMDVDIVLAMDAQNVERFLACAGELGLSPALPVGLHEFADPAVREEWVKRRNMIAFQLHAPEGQGISVDVLIGTGLDFTEAYRRREQRIVGDVPVALAAVEDMIALKEAAGRKQDMADLEALREIVRNG